VWRILIFEWILLIGIQTNCKNWVHTWANGIGYTRPNEKKVIPNFNSKVDINQRLGKWI
jgi:hypothetical protein